MAKTLKIWAIQKTINKRFKLTIISISNLKRYIHSFMYAILNRTDRQIDATLDLQGSTNMKSEYQKMILTKKIPPKTLEFMMHAEADKNAEEYNRSALLKWV